MGVQKSMVERKGDELQNSKRVATDGTYACAIWRTRKSNRAISLQFQSSISYPDDLLTIPLDHGRLLRDADLGEYMYLAFPNTYIGQKRPGICGDKAKQSPSVYRWHCTLHGVQHTDVLKRDHIKAFLSSTAR